MDATAISHAKARLAPAPAATPFTAAMTGLMSHEVRADREARSQMINLAVETIKVGKSLGYNVKPPSILNAKHIPVALVVFSIHLASDITDCGASLANWVYYENVFFISY